MRASVASGKLDAFDASSMYEARVADCTKGLGAKNYVVHFEPNRDRQCQLKSSVLPGLKKMSARIPVWVRNNAANRLQLSKEKQRWKFQHSTVTELKATLQTRGASTRGKHAMQTMQSLSLNLQPTWTQATKLRW